MPYLLPLLILLTPVVHAEMKSAKALSTSVKDAVFTGRLTEGYHFNDKAPNQIRVESEVVKPAKISPREISFQLPASFGAGEAALYVCDDAVTFCETHHVKLAGTAAKSSVKPAKSSPRKGRVDAHGFIEDDLEAALRLARKKKAPVLVDFGARWCPGCVRYETEMFPTAAFARMSKDFVKVRIDVDRFENFPLNEKYAISGIPALLALSPEGEEIGRLVDFQPVEKLEPFLAEVRRDPTPMTALKPEDSGQRLILSRRLMASGKAADAVALLEKVQPAPPELRAARVQAAEEAFRADDKKKDDYRRTLQSALKEEADSTRSLGWRSALAGLDEGSADSKKLAADGVKLADELLKDPAKLAEAVKTDAVGEFTGIERFLVAVSRADLVGSSGAPASETKAAWSFAADIGLEEKLPSRGPGPALRYLLILNMAERWSEGEKLADALLKKDPKNFDLRRRKIKILGALGKHAEAVKLGERLMKETDDRNQFWVAEGLAKSYLAVGRREDARLLLEKFLAREEVQMKPMRASKQSMEALLKTAKTEPAP